ncbi:MAG: hypothetical protein K0R36_3510 [Chryseobacterium sp.]|jgi:energy-coupling factor transporter transmembrane protein EcfT|nr:hypothetical protein [Chryseobacterium sp.]
MKLEKLNYYIGTILIIFGCVGIYMIDQLLIIIAILGIILVLFSDKKLWIKLVTIILLPIISILVFIISIFAFSEPL